MLNINAMPGYIPLGNQRDFGHAIQFDLTAWADLNADDWKITYTRPGESATYPVPDGDVSVTNGVLTWTISEAVTAINGAGSVVIEAYRGGEMLKHSDRIMTIIGEGHEPAGEAPDPVADWIEDATQKLAEVDPALGLAADATLAANTAAGRADTIAGTLEGIAPKWAAVGITASALAAGAAPTASITQNETGTSISLGIPKGDTGDTGNGIDNITLTDGNHDPGTTDTYTIAYTDTTTDTFTVYNGANGDITGVTVDGAEVTPSDGVVDLTSDLARYAIWRKTASGNPVSVYPVPESPLYPKVSGTFTQAGTGDPSPENIRPITPWLASGGTTKVKRTGKNLMDLNALSDGYLNSSLVFTPASSWRTTDFISVQEGATYFYTSNSYIASGQTRRGVYYDENKVAVSAILNNAGVSFLENSSLTIPAGIHYVRMHFKKESLTDFPNTQQFELGSVATPYEPYTEQDITLTAPQEIAAGWMDNEGHGQITHGYIASYVDETVPDGWVSSIGELSAGAQVVYPLATPIDITPTAAPLTALPQLDRVTPRQNVLTASTGNVELTYAKSPIREADELAAAIAALP